jgi:hypothetical protein
MIMKLTKKRFPAPFKSKEGSLLVTVSLLFAINSILFMMKGQRITTLFNNWSFESIYLTYLALFVLFLAVLIYILEKPLNFLLLVKKVLLLFLPSEIILLFTFHNLSDKLTETLRDTGFGKELLSISPFEVSDRLATITFSHLLIPLTYLYIITVCFYWFFKYKNYRKISDFLKDFQEKKEREASKLPLLKKASLWVKKHGTLLLFLVISVVLLNIGFSNYHLSEFAAVDEPLWTFGRITKFWNNVADGEFQKTMISDKPGITVAILSGFGLPFEDPHRYESMSTAKLSAKGLDIRNMNFALRFPITFFASLMLFAFYFLVRKLLGRVIAIISLIFIGLSPILLGISTIINPDALLWIFLPLSMLSYFLYMKNQENRFLYLAGFLLGLAVLTKYIANILYIFFFGLIFLEYIFNSKKYKPAGTSVYLKKALSDYAVLIFFSLLTFFLLLPAAWVDISRILEGTIYSKAFVGVWPIFAVLISLILLDMSLFKSKIITKMLDFLAHYKTPIIIIPSLAFLAFTLLTLAVTYTGMEIYDLEAILASPKTSYLSGGFSALMSANFYSLIFGITPLAFLGLLIAITANIKDSRKNNDKVIWSTYITIFILFYYLASTASNVSATVRYQIVIYPLALILASIGISYVVTSERIKKYIVFNTAVVALIIASVYSLNFIKPFYFSYASDLLPEKYILNIKDMGDGSFEAAQYLNSLPQPEKLSVWTDKRGVCAFFEGDCDSGFDFDKQKKSFDYFVVSSGREARTTKMTLSRVNGGNVTLFRLDKLYEANKAAFEIKIGGRPNNFVKVIKADSL